ncbi:MAG: MATE family efflux transporter [Lachnospiraceae bacterium]|nr:MATE family efflux transporter [Lachnospiraceae bacterium]
MKTKYKLIGSRAFYKMALAIAVPIMIQNGISNFVSMLDNLMIGRLGENAISGVAIANQLMFVYYLVIFGATAGVGIFTAQYYGMGDTEGVRYTFRFKLIANAIMTAICIGILLVFSSTLISLFLKGEGKPEDAAETLKIGLQYMQIMLIGLIPNGINQAYAGTLRDIGQTKVPMIASVIAIAVNFIGNLVLIYGLLGMPALGARGAAIATVASRFVELGVLVIYTTTHSKQHPFIIGAFRHFVVPGRLIGKFIVNSLPLMANETLWSLGMTFMNQSYSYRSLDAVASLNIENTLWSLMGVAFLAMGEAVGILIGQKLGRGEIEQAKGDARKLIAFTVACGVVFGILMFAISPAFPKLYKVSDSVKDLATKFIIVYAVMMPFFAFTHASYFTIRAGGKTWLTMLFDSCFVWLISVPTALILSRFTNVGIVKMVAIVQSLEIIKCIIGGVIVHSGIWARNIVGEAKKEV